MPSLRTCDRPRRHDQRDIINAIRYVLRNKVVWRALLHEYPRWLTVYHYFRLWPMDGTWEHLDDELRDRVRQRIDSPSL